MDTDAADDPDETEDMKDMKPISYHVLPVTVVTDYVQGLGVKHVADVLTIIFGCKHIHVRYERELGVSYAAFGATESQATFLRNQVRELHAELLDSSSDMYEPRLRDWKDIKGGENVTNDTDVGCGDKAPEISPQESGPPRDL